MEGEVVEFYLRGDNFNVVRYVESIVVLIKLCSKIKFLTISIARKIPHVTKGSSSSIVTLQKIVTLPFTHTIEPERTKIAINVRRSVKEIVVKSFIALKNRKS
ncbi:hypothetical protein ACKWTF_003210 [Chironomus riparius]